jgi:hypothetical protein
LALSNGKQKKAPKNPATALELFNYYFIIKYKLYKHRYINYINLVDNKSVVPVILLILSLVSSKDVNIPKFIDIALEIVGTNPLHKANTPSCLAIV